MRNSGPLPLRSPGATVEVPMVYTESPVNDPEPAGAARTTRDALEWLELLQYCDARSRLEPATRAGFGEPRTDPWPVSAPLQRHRMRGTSPKRDWEATGTATGDSRHVATFTAGEYVLRCGFGLRAVHTIRGETAYLETHVSPYLPELTAYGHGWIETRIPPGEIPERPGPWLYSLGRLMREMHELDRRSGRPGHPRLLRLQRVCGTGEAARARDLARERGTGRSTVTTHGNLRSRNVVTRGNRHLLVVTGFDRVATAAPERDTVSALLGLAPVVGLDAVARSLPLALDPGALTCELLVAIDRLAGSVGGDDPDAMTRRRSVQRLLDDLLGNPEVVTAIVEICQR